MADQAVNTLPKRTTVEDTDALLMIGAAEEYQIDYSKLADAVLNKLKSKTFELEQGTKSLPVALNELNSKTTTLDAHRIKILSTISLLEDAKKIIDKNVPSMTVFHLGGDGYTSNDLPNEHYRYGSAVLVVRNKHSISLMLYPESNKYDVYLNTISTGNWQGWKALAYKDYVDSNVVKFMEPMQNARIKVYNEGSSGKKYLQCAFELNGETYISTIGEYSKYS